MKKQYLVSLDSDWSALENMAKAAIKSNAIEIGKVSIDELAGYYYTSKVLNPSIYQHMELHNIGNCLLVDETICGTTKNLLMIEELEDKGEDDSND